MTKNKEQLREDIREAALNSLETFIRLVHPKRVLGSVHVELTNWMSREKAKTHQLVLLPRDHQKSAIAAYDACWRVTRNPAIRILYLSSTSTLAVKQLKFMKDILTSDIYRFYWPDMVSKDENKREKWTESEISVDHPLRKEENIRDSTIFTGGLTTSITGLHCDRSYFDDVVVKENAYTEEGRNKTKEQYSLLASIEAGDATQLVVGTRYHPRDLYNDLTSMEVDQYDKKGELSGTDPLYEKFERQVENTGDGDGEFLWPRQQRYDGVWFGFDKEILAKKRAQYLDKVQYYAQYYNNPNTSETSAIPRDHFQYYDKQFLRREKGVWYFKNERVNVFCAVDFAYTLTRRSDYSAIVVVGVNSHGQYFLLDIDRFQTDKISEYFSRILQLHQKWDFRKIRCEVTAAQSVIVKDLKDNYIRKHGLSLSIEEFKPNRYLGSKDERIMAILQPRYNNRQIFHYQGGHCQTLEEELIMSNPAHDDLKDALASAIDSCVAPSFIRRPVSSFDRVNQYSHSRFGGFM